MYGFPWPVAVLIVLLLGALIGVLNGLLVEVAQIDSFIATLGTGTMLYALALWHTGGRQVVGVAAGGLLCAQRAPWSSACRSPATTCWRIALVMWLVYEYLPIGRYLYAIGANPKAAALNGIPVRRFVIGAFIASGLADGAGRRAARRQAAHRPGQRRARIPAARPRRRLPRLDHHQARAASMSGARMIGVIILAVGISGIQQFGGSFWVEPLFNGVTLLVAIGIAGYAQRKRGRGRRKCLPHQPSRRHVGWHYNPNQGGYDMDRRQHSAARHCAWRCPCRR